MNVSIFNQTDITFSKEKYSISCFKFHKKIRTSINFLWNRSISKVLVPVKWNAVLNTLILSNLYAVQNSCTDMHCFKVNLLVVVWLIKLWTPILRKGSYNGRKTMVFINDHKRFWQKRGVFLPTWEYIFSNTLKINSRLSLNWSDILYQI